MLTHVNRMFAQTLFNSYLDSLASGPEILTYSSGWILTGWCALKFTPLGLGVFAIRI